MIVYSPALLLIGDASDVVQALATALVGIVALGACVQGYLLRHLSIVERLLAAASALALLDGHWQSDLAGAGLLAALLAIQVSRKRAAENP